LGSFVANESRVFARFVTSFLPLATMSSSLLVLTDFFPAADQAVAYATSLAAPLGAHVVLLHVRRTSLFDPEALTGTHAANRTVAHLALSRLAQGAAVPTSIALEEGQVLPAVAEAIERHAPVLVVLGRTNQEELPDELASTTALDLLQQAPYPLLVVPPQASAAAPPRRLLLAADGEAFTLGRFAGVAQRLLHALQAELTVLHCAPVADGHAALAAVHTVLQTGLTLELSPSQTRLEVANTPAEGILAAAQSGHYDAVVLLARRRSVLGRLFHHSVTAQVVLHSNIPVLVLPVE